jgi:endonuclease YncB( thermonuclease family)
VTRYPLYLFLPFLLILLPEGLLAESNTSYLNVQYINNYDGDSITFDIPNTPAIVGKDMVIRLRGIDTPELKKSKCKQEGKRALLAKNRVHSLLKDAKVINLHRTGRGKYFRIIADIEFDGHDLATTLLKEELAVPYFGGTRDHDWCNDIRPTPQSEQRGPAILPPVVNGVYVWPPPPKQEQ